MAAPVSVSSEVIEEFVRPAVSAIPEAMTRRLKPCQIALPQRLEGGRIASRWTEFGDSIAIEVEAADCAPHDLALELLLCVGQALWETMNSAEGLAWLSLLGSEMDAGVPGEIDEAALQAKNKLLSSGVAARSDRLLRTYARASFASTAAEYVHCLWHDVSIRAGVEHLPCNFMRRRLDLMTRWFPPNSGYGLYA